MTSLQPLLILNIRLHSHQYPMDEKGQSTPPHDRALLTLFSKIKVVIALTRPGSPLSVNVFQPFYRQLLYDM